MNNTHSLVTAFDQLNVQGIAETKIIVKWQQDIWTFELWPWPCLVTICRDILANSIRNNITTIICASNYQIMKNICAIHEQCNIRYLKNIGECFIVRSSPRYMSGPSTKSWLKFRMVFILSRSFIELKSFIVQELSILCASSFGQSNIEDKWMSFTLGRINCYLFYYWNLLLCLLLRKIVRYYGMLHVPSTRLVISSSSS